MVIYHFTLLVAMDISPLYLCLLTEILSQSLSITNSDGRTPLLLAAYNTRIEVTRFLLSINPSLANLQYRRKALGVQVVSRNRGRESFPEVISHLPVCEWQRQLGLQDEYLNVERTFFSSFTCALKYSYFLD